MSVCGEIENIEHEIKQLEERKTSILMPIYHKRNK